ncbi:MAG: hypothetical protein JXB49_32545 [Bacteroidales bacterium]|nr:hypothetical protein [Bacteroidales bacterium]
MTSDSQKTIRNLEKFTFTINKNGEIDTHGQSTIISDCQNYRLYVDGIIYNSTKDQLISGFILDGIEYVKQLEGNFLIFLHFGSTFYILTDKLNSRKAFYAYIDDSWYVSNNIDNLPKKKSKLSTDGLACYISNGIMLEDLTLFRDIKCAMRASIHRIKNGILSVENYWQFKFNYANESNITEAAYQKEFERLLINAVKLRYDKDSRTALSLSAGYDARGILGILRLIKATNVFCFSYALNDRPRTDSDAYISMQLASKCEYDHEIIKSYKGDLISILNENALEGKVLSNYSDELDAWHYVAEKNEFTDVFAGDMCFGVGGALHTMEEVFNRYVMFSSGTKWLKRYMSKKNYNSIHHSLNMLKSDILKKTDNYEHIQDKKDFFYFDQRIDHVLMPWRENIGGQVGLVHLPYLDGKIIDFVLKLPPHFRNSKSLYKKTISELLPDLFSIPQANPKGFYSANWLKEIAKNKLSLIKLIQESNSRLDEFISKEELMNMIEKLNPKIIEIKALFKKIVNVPRRIKAINKILNYVFGPVYRKVSPGTIIIRLILIRIYLSD